MSRPVGFESWTCFCLFSAGDPKQAVRDNHKTFFHAVWTHDYFYPEGTLSGQRIAWATGAYVCGMIGYAAETFLIKTILAIGNTLAFLVSLCKCDKQWIKERGVICLDSWIALGIGIVGIFIPPLAYRLDAAAVRTMRQLAPKIV